MSISESCGAVQCGTTVINRVKLPVYRLPSGAKVVERADKVSGHTEVISIEGARRFKTQEYAFYPEIESVVVGGISARPLALQTEEEQIAYGESVLRSFFERVIASGTEFKLYAEAR